MIKRLIFDLDNTLIIWKKEYISALETALEELCLSKYKDKIDEIINDMENKYPILTKENLLNDINRICGLNLNMSFVDKLLNEQKQLAESDQSIIDTLEYLSKKYELVVLTNYFKEVQIARLKKARILKYFKEIYAGDEFFQKPHPNSFKVAIGTYKKEECLMIGDNLDKDIYGALAFGISAIICDYNNKVSDSKSYLRITSFDMLKEIL